MVNPRKTITGLVKYATPKQCAYKVKLNQNESPYGLPSGLVQAIFNRLSKTEFNRYNDGESRNLRSLIAKKFSLSSDSVIVGAGIDELLYLLSLSILDPGDKVVRPVPSFSMYEICAKLCGAKDAPVMLGMDFELTEALVDECKDAKLIFLCRPNNPTSNSFDKGVIEKIITGTSGVVCIDEAYAEFAKENCLDFLKYENVVIMRTFSKAYSAAAIRLGYAISTPELIRYMESIRLPWNINVFSQVAGEVLLENELLFGSRIAEIKQNRDILVKDLKCLAEVLPSDSNFVVFKVSNPRAVFEGLLAQGILVRDVSGYPMLGNCLRVSVGTSEENRAFVLALKNCISSAQALSSVDSVIFDMDGVLINVSNSYIAAIKQTVLELSGRYVSDEEMNKIKSMPNSNNDWDVCYSLVYGIELGKIKRDDILYQKTKSKYQELYLGGLKDLERQIVSRQTINELILRGYKLGIATGRPRAEALSTLSKFFPGLFDERFVIALEDCEYEKPRPEPLLLAKERMECKNSVYIGDTINDLLAARSAGMNFVSVTAGLEADLFLQDANYLVKVLL